MEEEDKKMAEAEWKPITHYKPARYKASFLHHAGRTQEQELSEYLPETGWGTVKPVPPHFHDSYAAFALLIVGFKYFVPWLLALWYWRSENPTARLGALLCTIMIPLSISVVYFYGSAFS